MISIVIPVYNEEAILEKNILQLFDFCQKNIAGDWQIIISDNHSTDTTPIIAKGLAANHPNIKYFYLSETGKGRAVMSAWQKFQSEVYVFMDADLSVSLASLPALIAGIKSGADVVLGSRFASGSSVQRSFVRRLISHFLRLILKVSLGLKVKDAPCGFKAVNQKVVDQIIPQIKNQTWFFDTELIILAEGFGLKIQEIPVVWQEPKNAKRPSKVGLSKVISEYLKNIYRLYSTRR